MARRPLSPSPPPVPRRHPQRERVLETFQDSRSPSCRRTELRTEESVQRARPPRTNEIRHTIDKEKILNKVFIALSHDYAGNARKKLCN